MKTKLSLSLFILFISAFSVSAQTEWKVCTAPVFGNRVDDIFMLNTLTGYAVSGDGKIVKTIDGGENWFLLHQSSGVYLRSVEFSGTQKGFVGGFPIPSSGFSQNILRRTTDGGFTWTDLTSLLPQKAMKGICGLAIPDSNTIYGCGNWFQDSAYIIKSIDGGNTWNLIDMSSYATSLIDMNFVNKDTGFVTGKGLGPLESAVILYTTNGGLNWSYKFQNNIASEYCWKIQRLTKQIYFASIEDFRSVPPKVLRSSDGGMTWAIRQVATAPYNIEGIGFIDPMKGWTGGDHGFSFETLDGGNTWNRVNICPLMNRVIKVNDTMLFATGDQIWKYKGRGIYPPIPENRYAWMNCHPNPVRDLLTINVSLAVSTHVMLLLLDATGRRIKVIDNADKPRGSYQYYINTENLARGIYYLVLKTHEDKRVVNIIVTR